MQKILIVGACPSEKHIRKFKLEHPGAQVWTVDILDCMDRLTDLRFHIVADLKRPLKLQVELDNSGFTENSIDFVIFDSQVNKFIGGRLKFLAYYLLFNYYLKIGGKLIMECCLTGDSAQKPVWCKDRPNEYCYLYSTVFGENVEVFRSREYQNERVKENKLKILAHSPENIDLITKEADILNDFEFDVIFGEAEFPLENTTDPIYKFLVATKRKTGGTIEGLDFHFWFQENIRQDPRFSQASRSCKKEIGVVYLLLTI